MLIQLWRITVSRLDLSVRPRFHVDKQFAQQYDTFVRLSPLYLNLVQALLERVHITKGDRVLCLASGTGLDARAASEAGAAAVFGLDSSSSMVAVAREASDVGANIHFVQADAAVIPFPKGHFDKALINAAGNYLWDQIYPLFVEVQRVLKPQGMFAFNCQSDEIEQMHSEDPQRQLRRIAYLSGWNSGYGVRLSAKPSVAFIAQLAQETGLTLLESTAMRIPTTTEDVLQQLRLPQFHEPFLGGVPEDKRDALLLDAANTLRLKKVTADKYRSWHFFVFKKQEG
jgi:ubiquinone/menaquinone biosynthesis C-methylase UbiE